MTPKQAELLHGIRHCLVVLAFATVLLPALYLVSSWVPQQVDEDGEPIGPLGIAVTGSIIASGLTYWGLVTRLRKDQKKIKDLRTAIQIAACDHRIDWRSMPDLDTYCPTRNLPLAFTLAMAGLVRAKPDLDEYEQVIASERAIFNPPDHVRAAIDAVEHPGPDVAVYWRIQAVSKAFRSIIDYKTRERSPKVFYISELNLLDEYRASMARKTPFAQIADEVKDPLLAAFICAIAGMVEDSKRIEESKRRELNEAFIRQIEIDATENGGP